MRLGELDGAVWREVVRAEHWRHNGSRASSAVGEGDGRMEKGKRVSDRV